MHVPLPLPGADTGLRLKGGLGVKMVWNGCFFYGWGGGGVGEENLVNGVSLWNWFEIVIHENLNSPNFITLFNFPT